PRPLVHRPARAPYDGGRCRRRHLRARPQAAVLSSLNHNPELNRPEGPTRRAGRQNSTGQKAELNELAGELVDEAPAPGLTGLGGTDYRMAGGVEMLSGVLAG